MTATTTPPRRTRATQRQAHEQHLAEVTSLLSHATTLTEGPELVETLDSALLILTRCRHGSRDVLRTDRFTTRETHRRTVDRRIAQIHELTYVLSRELHTHPPSDDRTDALAHLDWIARIVVKIGYR